MATWNLSSLISFFSGTLIRNMPSVQHGMLERAGVMVEEEAKRVLGDYEYGWAPLSPYTIAKKATGDSPGLETGEMRDSVYHTVTYGAGGNGSKSLPKGTTGWEGASAATTGLVRSGGNRPNGSTWPNGVRCSPSQKRCCSWSS